MLSPAPLRVGSWPGSSFTDNGFIRTFTDAIQTAGAIEVDVSSPDEIESGAIDVLQIHWPEQVYWRGTSEKRAELNALRVILSVRRLKRSGTRVVWMVHNLKAHDALRRRRLAWRLYSAALARLIDGYVALSPATESVIRKGLHFPPRVRAIAVRHPTYAAATEPLTRSEARRRWSVADSPLVLTFAGSVRPYKGVESLVSAVKDMAGRVSVVIGGQVRGGDLERLLPALADGAPVDLRLRRLPEAEFEGVVQASDYVVLPFQDILHSGSVIHALSLGRPVLTTRTPYTSDLQQTIGPEWVQLFDGELTAERLSELPPPPSGTPDLSALAPDKMGREIVAFYHSLF